LISKTGFITIATAALATAVSKELYIFNDESVILICSAILVYLITSLGGAPYSAFVASVQQQHSHVLNSARAEHKQAVQERIDSVGQMRNVVDITKDLFEVSKDTAKVEAEVFELQQKVDFAAEAKSVLDSWVRYEANQRQREQKQMADTITAKIRDELRNPRLQQQLLTQAINDVESMHLILGTC
jgi:F-type H+-transporting ATPase subunit b